MNGISRKSCMNGKPVSGSLARSSLVALATLFFILPDICHGAPPPPVPPGYPDVANELRSCIADRADNRCLHHLSPEVRITEDGKYLGQGWGVARDLFKKLIGRGWSFEPVVVAQGGSEILVLEKVSNLPARAEPGIVHDCCYWTRAVKYTLSGERCPPLTSSMPSQPRTYASVDDASHDRAKR